MHLSVCCESNDHGCHRHCRWEHHRHDHRCPHARDPAKATEVDSGIAGSSSLRFGYTVSNLSNDTFRALAHPLRREIVERLSEGAATVGDVTRDFEVSKPTISRHLRVLEEAGIVSRVIVGRSHRLALRPEALAEAEEWIENQRTRWERLFDVVGEYLKERT